MLQTHIDTNSFSPHHNLPYKTYYCQYFANEDTESQRV